MPQRGELHAVKILNDATSLFHYFNADNGLFLQSENFQRKFMHELPKLLWNTEKLEDLGDFVLRFPNPANIPSSVSGTSIKFEEAEEFFFDIFDTAYTYPYKRKFMTALKEAHDLAFLEIDQRRDTKAEAKLAPPIVPQLSMSPSSAAIQGRQQQQPGQFSVPEPSNSKSKIY